MLLTIIKFFHLICGISFFGITIASFFYIARSIYNADQTLVNYSIKASYFGDLIILLCIIIQTITSTSLVAAGHYTLQIPWIFVAYHAFGILVLLWLMLLVMKRFQLSKTLSTNYAIKFYYLINVTMLLIFIVIIHDAVTQSTWFEFLFKG